MGRAYIDKDVAVGAVRALSKRFRIDSVMTFGGEPLLWHEIPCAIHSAAASCGIPKRQLITNGYFTKDPEKIRRVAADLAAADVSDVLLSVDAFHQASIPLAYVRQFASALLKTKIPSVRLHPAWVIDEENDNRYNETTRQVLASFADLGIASTRGNDIFPEGAAAENLTEFYPDKGMPDLSLRCGEARYTDRLDNVRCLSIEPDGEVVACAFTIGNLGRETAEEIVARYDPYADGRMRALLENGVAGLLRYASGHGVEVDPRGCRTACAVCRKTVAAMKSAGVG